MPRSGTVNDSISRALHECRDREAAIGRIQALPGMTTERAIALIDRAMAANRAANRWLGTKMLIIGVLLAVVDAYVVIQADFFQPFSSTRGIGAVLFFAVMSVVLLVMGVVHLSAPSPYRFKRED